MVLPNNNYLVRKISTNKTQVLHRMQMRQCTPRQPPADIRITPQEWKPDPEVSLKHYDLYARSWECDYERPNFDAENNNVTPPTSTETPVQSVFSNEQKKVTTRTAHESSQKFFPKRKN